MTAKIPPEMWVKIECLVKDGVRAGEIASRLGVCHTTVWRAAHRLGVPPNPSHSIPICKWDEVRQLVAAGHSLQEIGAALRASKPSVHRLLRRLGLKTHKRNRNLERVRELSLRGMTFHEIATELSLHPKYISQLEARAGLPSRWSPLRRRMVKEAADARCL